MRDIEMALDEGSGISGIEATESICARSVSR
jgi:hypothetical protein